MLSFFVTGTTHNSPERPHLLPVRGLNEIFIGESLSSRYISLPTFLWRCGASHHHEHFISHFSSSTLFIPPSPLTCGFLFATGWSINPSNPILPSRFIGLHTTKSPSTTGRGRSRRAQGLAFALELDQKPGELLKWSYNTSKNVKRCESYQIIFLPSSRSYNINKLVEQAVEDVLRIG